MPNPADDILNLNVTDGATVSIFDMNGRMLKQDSYRGQLNVSKPSSGIYTIKIEDITLRFVKE
ncbi:MAG: T9SS type A sorting domain-containing protein [Bacteroidales bacterium]|nr:T9SS type A sorting domain-containing protein [Bacteroidales bacterium]